MAQPILPQEGRFSHFPNDPGAVHGRRRPGLPLLLLGLLLGLGAVPRPGRTQPTPTTPAPATEPAPIVTPPRPTGPDADPTTLPAPMPTPKAAPRSGPPVHALLLNGGGNSKQNFLSHLNHLQDMMATLRARGVPPERIHVFSGDGEEPQPDLAVRQAEPPGFWLLRNTETGRLLHPLEATDTRWPVVRLQPARLVGLRQLFVRLREELLPGDTLFVFVTDHGTRDPDDPTNAFITLWNEKLSVLEYRALLAHLQPGVRVVSVMSQCYSGAFADSMLPLWSTLPSGDSCGFFSTTHDRRSYGCYAEGRDRDRLGHAFTFSAAMQRHGTLPEVQTAVTLLDNSPDLPLCSSDLLLERVVRTEAEARQQPLEAVADEALAQAWRRRGPDFTLEPQIRLLDRLAEVYGIPSPRTFAELQPRLDTFQRLSQEVRTYEERWQAALDDLRRVNLQEFQQAQPAWKEWLEPGRLRGVTAEERQAMLSALLPELEAFSRSRPAIWQRLQENRNLWREARAAAYRIDIRWMALLRARIQLLRVAGQELLRPSPEGPRPPHLAPLREALARLERCEAAPLGQLPPGLAQSSPLATAPPPLPPFQQDLAAVKRALPSWLGVRFHPAASAVQQRFGVTQGSVVVEQVFPESPAQSAGLRIGDLLLGPPGARFTEPNQVREWTMTSPRDHPLPLEVLREGQLLQVAVTLKPYPLELGQLPAPPQAGDPAPPLRELTPVRPATTLPGPGQRQLLFFWATWCGPCKDAVPTLLAWSRRTGIPVVAITDEPSELVLQFLQARKEPFPELVASDLLRLNFAGYGIHATPTFLLLDGQGKVTWRHKGYSAARGLPLP